MRCLRVVAILAALSGQVLAAQYDDRCSNLQSQTAALSPASKELVYLNSKKTILSLLLVLKGDRELMDKARSDGVDSELVALMRELGGIEDASYLEAALQSTGRDISVLRATKDVHSAAVENQLSWCNLAGIFYGIDPVQNARLKQELALLKAYSEQGAGKLSLGPELIQGKI